MPSPARNDIDVEMESKIRVPNVFPQPFPYRIFDSALILNVDKLGCLNKFLNYFIIFKQEQKQYLLDSGSCLFFYVLKFLKNIFET